MQNEVKAYGILLLQQAFEGTSNMACFDLTSFFKPLVENFDIENESTKIDYTNHV
ncbi:MULTISPECIES: hypothetical protein [unclassified Mucilaginibacter]|uniref:hypothetical protein n=1 Tax=unclassified Mucilaginibacter TaxID=2617802 RepID=UPI002AC9CFA8|nr:MULTISPECIES: hypothetical protein [unclassified Mucilaginibacter]MEB0280874.1 hypothetical protein [Mucilaginibacter sp. 10B2]MEB0302745.1 hypothetical protein [Mucilaginibacter sp. 5C4]WPX25643.1 hypothetical protein RHM67_10240 [Mucilaginibacter sp. 5C4]